MIALIDFDILLYRVGYTTENDDLLIAKIRMDELIQRILHETNAESFRGFVTDSANNFRFDIYPGYKANRKQPKPRHLEDLTNYLLSEWNAEVAWGEEADDQLGITQTKYNKEGKDCVICSIDKDLKQIEGKHYNFVKNEWDYVDKDRGTRTFYYQCLVGDVADNITGCPGIGKIRAGRILDRAETNRLYNLTFKEFERCYGDEAAAILERTAQAIKIRTVEGEIWSPPTES